MAATVGQLRASGLDLVSPYPRQVAVTPAERLVQPLLQWSFLTTLPLRAAERSRRPSLSAANGQLLAVDRGAYRRAGGHASAPADVLDDLALLRSVKAAGGRGGVTDGTDLAACRMYRRVVRPARRVRQVPVGGVRQPGRRPGDCRDARAGLLLAGRRRAGRLPRRRGRVPGRGRRPGATGRRTGARVWPDALAHPASVAVFGWLTVRSVREHRRGALRWKGRPVR